MRHGFQRRQTESFIQRRKHEDLCLVVEDAQYLDGHKAEKADIVLHSALHHRTPQVGMFGNLIPDNDQLQVLELLFFGQLSLQSSKRLDDAHNVLVWADAACVEQKRGVDLVAFGDELAVCFAGMTEAKALVDRVVDDLDFFRWNLEEPLRVLLREVGHSEDPRRMMKYALGELEMQVAFHRGMTVDAVHVVEQVVNCDHIRTGNGLWLPEEVWHMQQVAVEAFQQTMQLEVAPNRKLIRLRGQEFEIRRQTLDAGELSRNPDEEVFVLVVQARKGANGVARVSPDAELANTPDIDRNPHDSIVSRGANRKATARGGGGSGRVRSVTPSPLLHASPFAKRTAETLRLTPTLRGECATARSCPCGCAAPPRSTCRPGASRLPSCRAW